MKVWDHFNRSHPLARFNAALAIRVTDAVGTMWCAYLFTALALVSLPATIASHDPTVIVQWIAQTFLQLVLLSVILVGQKVQARAADQRAADTYADTELILAEIRTLKERSRA